MKKINISILSLVAILGFTTSCTNDIDQSYPAINDKPVITITADQSSIVELNDEATDLIDENIATYTMTASEAYTTDMKFKIEFLPSESTGSLDDIEVSLDASPIDFGIEGFLAIMPKNNTIASFTITSVFDVLPEGAETFKFKVYPVGDLNGSVADASQTFTLTIGNSISYSLSLTFDWDKSFEFGGAPYTLCDIVYDNDFYVVSGGTSILDAAATTECLETLEMNINDYPDGDYDIYQNLYDNAGLADVGITPAFSIPVNVNYNRQGSATLTGTYVQDAAYAVDSNAASDPNFDTPIYVVSVNVTAGVFTLFDDNGNISSGRKAQVKNLIKAYKKAKNLKK